MNRIQLAVASEWERLGPEILMRSLERWETDSEPEVPNYDKVLRGRELRELSEAPSFWFHTLPQRRSTRCLLRLKLSSRRARGRQE